MLATLVVVIYSALAVGGHGCGVVGFGVGSFWNESFNCLLLGL